jgi:hypothetical protein
LKHPDELLREARIELRTKHRVQVNQESAWRWAALAVAAYELGQLSDAVDYHHEAVEHAALADHSGLELQAVRNWVSARVPPGVLH